MLGAMKRNSDISRKAVVRQAAHHPEQSRQGKKKENTLAFLEHKA
jgi:hypothetical protein